MSSRLNEVAREIQVLKDKLAKLWEEKKETDQEILAIADQIDRLLNEHDHLLQEKAG